MSVEYRRIPMEAILNMRDLGGLQTADGRRVRKGVVFRSGTPAFALSSGPSWKCVVAAGWIATVCDEPR